MDCGDDAADWISGALEQPGLRLVYAAGGIRERVSGLFFGEDGGIRTDGNNKVLAAPSFAWFKFLHHDESLFGVMLAKLS